MDWGYFKALLPFPPCPKHFVVQNKIIEKTPCYLLDFCKESKVRQLHLWGTVPVGEKKMFAL